MKNDTSLDDFIDRMYEALGSIGARGTVARIGKQDDGTVDIEVRFTVDNVQFKPEPDSLEEQATMEDGK